MPRSKHAFRSLAEFFALIEQLVREWTPSRVEWYLQPWFRGHGDARWPLRPSLYRMSKVRGVGSEYYNEAQLLDSFKRRAPRYLDRVPQNDWEWLFVMQHHGLPTRLLDWTESAVVALYFAVRDATGKCDAAVWATNPWWINSRALGDYTQRLAARRRERGLPGALGPVPGDEAVLLRDLSPRPATGTQRASGRILAHPTRRIEEMSKRTAWVATAALGLALGGVAVAQGPSAHGPMGPHMMPDRPGMMGPGQGMMGHGMGMGMGCPLMTPGAEMKVEKLENGVSITLTSSDPKEAARIQKRAEIMRLMHELQQDEP